MNTIQYPLCDNEVRMLARCGDHMMCHQCKERCEREDEYDDLLHLEELQHVPPPPEANHG